MLQLHAALQQSLDTVKLGRCTPHSCALKQALSLGEGKSSTSRFGVSGGGHARSFEELAAATQASPEQTLA